MRLINEATELTVRSLMVLAMSIILGSIAAWVTLAFFKVVVAPAAVLATVTGVVIWVAVQNSGGSRTPPPPLPPARPQRPITWDDAQRAAELHRMGVITKAQLDATLKAVVPPTPSDAPPCDRGRHGRR